MVTITLQQKSAASSLARIIHMPELAYALQCYLEPKYLAMACLVNKDWHQTWIPFLWRTLTLTQPPSRSMSNGPRQVECHFLSEECLGRFGHHVRRLNASWLSPQVLLRLSTHCLNIQHIKLTETSIHTEVLKSMLGPLSSLRILELDLPMEDFADDEDQEEIGPDENALLKSIELYSSPRLKHLELTFQTSVRIPVRALCSMLRNHPALRTVKFVDADIVDSISRKSKKHRRGRKVDKKNRTSRDEAIKAPVESLPPISGSLIPRSPSTSGSEDETSTSPTLAQPLMAEPFGLLFLSITSTHTSDSSLGHILERCTRLRALHLHSCDRITDTTLENIVHHLPCLSSISLSTCKKMTTAGLGYFFKNAPTPLAHVHLCDMSALRDEALESLARRHCRSLKKLAIYFCAFITDIGIKTLLTTCNELRILGIQASGMTTNIFEQPWACHETLEQLDLQGIFKLSVPDTPSGNDNTNNYIHSNAGMSEFSATRAWRDRQAKINAFEATRLRLMTLSRLKNLRLAAGEIGKQVLEGFGRQQKIEVLHLYGLQSSQVDQLPWGSIRAHYPYLRQIYCGVIGVSKKNVKDELARANIELFTTSTIPDLAFENNFDD